MGKIKTNVVNSEEEVAVSEGLSNRIELAAVKQLEEATKVGFYVELKSQDDSYLEQHVRLMCESKDGESDDTPLTPWCSPDTLSTMVNGCLFLHPLLLKVIRDRQKNAENPEENA